ncbi:MAG: acetyl-CoA decarbonylase/synthase complex subunit delta [Deltaproteobacteria bacterium]|nr:acetyl-CoA decarbonylase/synthase complex subunit delta [Deltaproteobacteria bacterium]
MAFDAYKESYTGQIKAVTLGKGDKAVTLGGETCYPFYTWEGEMPNKPVVAMEVWDMEPEDWPEAALAPVKDVAGDPVAWAKKCVDEFGAKAVVLQLKSTDPNGKDASAADAAATVKKVAGAIDVPLIVWGVANPAKDEEVLKKVAEECQGMNLTLGPVEDKNHKGIGAAAMGFGHTVISSSPIDVNLAKQVNILLENLGVPMDHIVVDPTTGGLGYGLEYSYSVMERLSMAALAQGDDKLQLPVINNLGNEVWKSKEAKLTGDEAPELGDPERRGILMEVTAGVAYLLAGSDMLIVRHPESRRMLASFIELALEGGSAKDIADIDKKLDLYKPDYAALAPEPDLTIEEEKKAAPKPKAAASKKEEKPAAAAKPKEEKPAEPAKPKAEAAPEPKEAPAPEKAAAPSPEEAKAKAEEAAKAKAAAEAEAAAKLEAEKKAKEEAEKKAKAEAEAKEKAAKEKAEAEARAKREAEEEAIRQQRAAEREKRAAERKKAAPAATKKTPAKVQMSALDKLIANLDRVHRRQ